MLTGNIQKGGAMLEDTRRVLDMWDDDADPSTNLQLIADGNLLGHATRKRTHDVLLRIIGPRYVEPGPEVIPALRALRDDPGALLDACYYETARDDELLATFAEQPIFSWYSEGRIGVSVDDAKTWLEALTAERRLPEWTDTVRTKVARGLLAALRDFGVLRGGIRKEFSSPGMTPRGFAYVAYREHQQGASARAILESTIWRRWLLDDRWVHDLMTQVDRLGILHYSRAGSAVRIDWRAESLLEVSGAAA